MSDDIQVIEPVPISLIGNRYLVFDVNTVLYLRRFYHICGTPIGTLPQIPQQNLFLGLPIELMREEAKLLTDKHIAYIVDDHINHKERYGNLKDGDRIRFIESLKTQGLKTSQFLQSEKRNRTEKALSRMDHVTNPETTSVIESSGNDVNFKERYKNDVSNFQQITGKEPDDVNTNAISVINSQNCHAITPTISYISSSVQNTNNLSSLHVSHSYVLYKYLHELGYFILPGLRFGCNYNVYPGDPLRFHSHFIAVAYEWKQSIPTFDIIGGGRLGTAVKKGFLIGGNDTENDQVRTFAIEWGGM